MDPYRDVGTDFPHLQMAKELVEQAYKNTGLPVYLAGHSNGPLYTMALLNSVSEDWRRKHIGEILYFESYTKYGHPPKPWLYRLIELVSQRKAPIQSWVYTVSEDAMQW